MPTTISGSTGVTFPAGGVGNPAGAVVGTTDTQTLTNKSFNSASVDTVSGTAPLYMARAWVNFNGAGTVAIRASGNVSSITDNAAGSWTVNFSTTMPDTNYSTQATASAINIASNNTMAFIIEAIAPTTSAVTVGACNDAGAARDSIYVCVAVFR